MMLSMAVCDSCKKESSVGDFLLPESFGRIRDMVMRGFGKAEPGIDLTELRWLEVRGTPEADLMRVEDVRKGWLR